MGGTPLNMNVNASEPLPLSFGFWPQQNQNQSALLTLEGVGGATAVFACNSFFLTFLHVAQISIALGHHFLPHVRAKGSGKQANG